MSGHAAMGFCCMCGTASQATVSICIVVALVLVPPVFHGLLAWPGDNDLEK